MPSRLRQTTGFKIIAATLILASIGLIRCVWANSLGISLDEKWYSLDPDVLLVMACYPVYLCFFIFLCSHLIFRFFGFKNIGYKLFAFFFFIQFAHLIIPPADYMGMTLGIPWNLKPYLNAQIMTEGFSLNPFDDMPNMFYFPIYFTPLLMLFTRLTTFGINLTWILVFAAFLIFSCKILKIPFGKSLLILSLIFQVMYWPIYKYFFIFDGLFNYFTATPYHNHFGYALYFLLSSVVGITYFIYASKKTDF